MVQPLIKYWWLVALRGLVAVFLGAMAVVNPGDTVTVLVQLFGLFLIIDGILLAVLSILGRESPGDWWFMLLHGALEFAIGIGLFFVPGLSAQGVVYVVGLSVLAAALMDLISASWLRQEQQDFAYRLFPGLLGLLFGWALLGHSAELAAVGALPVGTFLGIVGLTGLVFGLKLRAMAPKPAPAKKAERQGE
jgi:uncharacterized membrane protein HdeD (DUF308 family)